VTRAQCLSCHKNLTKHHPDAPFCQTCHSFQ
jgi:Zn finger protein HypA/HybF involved in hydrogenase expression